MSRQVDNKPTIQVRIDRGLHKLLKIQAAQRGTTLRSLLDEYGYDGLDREKHA